VRDGIPDGERASAPLMVAIANGLALVALSAEAVGYFDRMAPAVTDAGVLDEWKAFSLTVVWTLYGAGASLYGARRRARGWRYGCATWSWRSSCRSPSSGPCMGRGCCWRVACGVCGCCA